MQMYLIPGPSYNITSVGFMQYFLGYYFSTHRWTAVFKAISNKNTNTCNERLSATERGLDHFLIDYLPTF